MTDRISSPRGLVPLYEWKMLTWERHLSQRQLDQLTPGALAEIERQIQREAHHEAAAKSFTVLQVPKTHWIDVPDGRIYVVQMDVVKEPQVADQLVYDVMQKVMRQVLPNADPMELIRAAVLAVRDLGRLTDG